MFPHVVEEKVCSSGGRDCSDHGNEMCMLCDRIDDNHNGIVPCRLWQLNNEVHTDSITWSRWNGKRWSSPIGGCRNDLVRRHMSQVEMYLPTYLDTLLALGGVSLGETYF